jgi:hypothetical protein
MALELIQTNIFITEKYLDWETEWKNKNFTTGKALEYARRTEEAHPERNKKSSEKLLTEQYSEI